MAFVTALANGLHIEHFAELLVAVAPLGLRILTAHEAPPDDVAGAGIARAFAALASRLHGLPAENPPRRAVCVAISQGFGCSVRLLTRLPSARTISNSQASEAWLRASMSAGGAAACGATCVEFLDTAEAEGSAPLLNLAWRLLKQLCLDASCDPDTVNEALRRSAGAAASHLATAAAASSHRAAAAADDKSLFVATFHCSNFLRLARDAPVLTKGDFPLSSVVAALASGLSGTSLFSAQAGTPKARDLLDKLVSMALERWNSTSGWGGGGDDLGSLLEKPDMAEVLVVNAIALIASGRASGGSRLGALFEEVLTAAERLACSLEDAFWVPISKCAAIMCTSGAPHARSRLLNWTLSRHPGLYCLALQVHRSMATMMTSSQTVAWVKLLYDGLFATESPGPGSLLRGQGQAASCMALLLVNCPYADAVDSWVQAALVPLVSEVSHRSICPPAPLWSLAGRLAAAAAAAGDNPGAKAVRAALETLAKQVLSALDSGGHGGAPRSRAWRFRGLAALVRWGIVPRAEVESMGPRLRVVLGDPCTPLAVRAEVWEAHAEVCLRVDAADDFRVSVRYALKHLTEIAPMGARVAGAVARAPSKLACGTDEVLEGLSSAPWPLRISGLAASTCVCARRPRAIEAVVDAAQVALKAFASMYGGAGAKRRRLLVEVMDLHPPDRVELDNDDMRNLCLSARAHIDSWIHADAGFQGARSMTVS